MEDLTTVDIRAFVDLLSDGVYVGDLDRRITYWSKSAERITGWSAEDVVRRPCFDNILCHLDKEDHPLCGEEYCPLHRAIITGAGSKSSLLVFAQGKNGQRIPMQVSVAPLRNSAGDVIGGVETFQDASAVVHDLERAKAIQQLALRRDLPADDRIRFTTSIAKCRDEAPALLQAGQERQSTEGSCVAPLNRRTSLTLSLALKSLLRAKRPSSWVRLSSYVCRHHTIACAKHGADRCRRACGTFPFVL